VTGPGNGEAAVITGCAAVSAFGRGVRPLFAAAVAGKPAFQPVQRFDVQQRRVRLAAALPGEPALLEELVWSVEEACRDADLSTAGRHGCPLLLGVHGHPDLARAKGAVPSAAGFGEQVAGQTGLTGFTRAYTSGCVAASLAVADAAALVAAGRHERVVVAAGYLVEPDQFALFDAGRALAVDGSVRPFSARRSGLLLGDGVAAVVVESARSAHRRGARARARLAGWGRAGDAYHVCKPHPDGAGLARATRAAMTRAGVGADDIGYVNAHGSGTPASDAAEAAALRLALGDQAGRVPVSSTKSVHGQALEASALLELIITVLALEAGELPVNAGFLEPDPLCPLDLVVGASRAIRPDYALSLNSAFGGSNTALLVGAA
jgi:3-oxoacyl-[acyl-carrier-protein] synthase II